MDLRRGLGAGSLSGLMSLRLFQNLIVASALILVAALQVSGGAVRYLCQCTGDLSFSVQEHCHDQHGHADHHHGEPGHRHANCHTGHGDHEPGDAPIHRHQPIAMPTVAVPVTMAELPAIPFFHSVVPAALPLSPATLAENAPADLSLRPPWLRDDPPPTHLLVTRSVVRLI